jgi:hypothetical protein
MWLFISLPLVAFFAILVIHASSSLDKLKANWNQYRCHPAYIPFAGYIRPDVSTSENFLHCLDLMGNELMKPILDELNALFATIHAALAELTGPLDLIRQMFTRIRKFMLSFANATFSKITASMSVFTHYLLKMKDMMGRYVGQGYVGAYMANVGIDFVVSLVMLVMGIVKTFVYGLLAASFLLALFQPELLVLAITLAALIGASGF